VLAAATQAALWDEFWHWLPSAAYAYTHDALARRDLPPSFSQWPAYPQTIPLALAASSFLAHRFLESAGAVTNVALLASYAALLADTILAIQARQGGPSRRMLVTGLTAAAVAAVLVCNPGLDGEVLRAAYADSATMMMVGASGLLGIELLARLKWPTTGSPAEIAWRFGFVAAALVNLKQSNPVLLALILAGIALVVVLDRDIRLHDAVRLLPRMVGPAIVVFVCWRWYVATNFPSGEPGVRPIAAWNWAALPDLFISLGRYVREAPLFCAEIWLVAAAGIAVMPGLSRSGDETRWLAVITAAVWLGYNTFLLLVYLAVFSDAEARLAGDYWRYAPHVGLLALSAVLVGLTQLSVWKRLRFGLLALACSVMALSAPWLRTDLASTPTRQWALFVRSVADDVKPLVPPRAKVALAFGYKVNPYPVIMHYEFWQLGDTARAISSADVWESEDIAEVRAKTAEADYLILHDGQGTVADLASEFGVSAPEHEVILFARRGSGWEKMRSWQLPALAGE
jgi:hypothetical protein